MEYFLFLLFVGTLQWTTTGTSAADGAKIVALGQFSEVPISSRPWRAA